MGGNVPATAHGTCACQPPAMWPAPRSPRKEASSGWHLCCRASRISCLSAGRCPSLAGSSPEGVVTSPRRRRPGQQCLQWEAAAPGPRAPGGGVLRPPSKASGIRHCPVALPAQTWSPGETQSRLPPGGPRQNCRPGAPGLGRQESGDVAGIGVLCCPHAGSSAAGGSASFLRVS